MMSEAFTLCKILEERGHEARLAGGAVRDFVMGVEPKDFDIATTARPGVVLSIFNSLGFQVIPTGLKHGTVTVRYEDEDYEITTLRIDVETDGRHAEVEYTEDWLLDAQRRDFTMNAMFMDRDMTIYDFFGGEADANGHVVKFVGRPEERIREDGLRILRFFRFLARYEGTADPESLKMCNKLSKYALRNVSKERIASEVQKIIEYDVDSVLLQMNGHKTASGCVYSTSTVLFGRDLNPAERKSFPDGEWELSLLSMGVGAEWFREHKCSRSVISNVEFHETFELTDANYDSFVHGRKRVLDHAILRDVMDYVDVPDEIPPFPISGNDLLDLGFKGKEVGDMLEALARAWCNSDFALTYEELMEKVDELS